MQRKKLGILLSTAPSDPAVGVVVRLAEEALRARIDVYLYLIDEGVRNLRDPRYVALGESGAKLFVCAYGCQRHGLPTETVPASMTLCGLVILSNIIAGCDRFLAFT
jgi:sulfur relay (sulfurtransferase) complex TusBCD TusD component (DsrE family)